MSGAPTAGAATVGIVVRHPEHARFFAPVYEELTARGHEATAFVREHGHATAILDCAGVPHEVLAGEATSRLSLVAGHLAFEARLLNATRQRGFDVLSAVGGLAVSHVAPLAGARSVAFVDWNRAGLADATVAALADVVCTPRFVDARYGTDQIRYEGYHELAYLHPDRFEPDPDAFRADADLAPDAPLFVVGFRDGHGRVADRIASSLSAHGEVLISHEGVVPASVDADRVVPFDRAHDALAAADLFVGDSGAMAAEAAMLGTPAVRFCSRGADPRCADLEERHGLVVTAADPRRLFEEVRALAGADADERAARRRAMLDEAVDVAGLAADLLVREATR